MVSRLARHSATKTADKPSTKMAGKPARGGQALDLLTIALKINNAGSAFDIGQNKRLA